MFFSVLFPGAHFFVMCIDKLFVYAIINKCVAHLSSPGALSGPNGAVVPRAPYRSVCALWTSSVRLHLSVPSLCYKDQLPEAAHGVIACVRRTKS